VYKRQVPLARIKDLLAADPDRFAAAIAEIDRNLQERSQELRHTRERIARLKAGDRLFVSAQVGDYLDLLVELGVSQRLVQMERDGWILLQSVSPKDAAIWMADKRDAISDPEFRALYVDYDTAFDWSPDDPRLYTLADRAERWLARRSGRLKARDRSTPDRTIVRLISSAVGASSPAWDRLAAVARERSTARE